MTRLALPTSGYAIEKGIPVPHPRSPRQVRYPFRQMAVGDSFLIPSKDAFACVQQSVRGAARSKGMKASVRKVAGGVRVWRVA